MAKSGTYFRLRAAGLCLAALGVLIGCVQTPTPMTPQSRPESPTAATVTPAAVPRYTPSPQSQKIRDYYANLQSNFLLNDLLRTDSGDYDAPFSSHVLARNFNDVALHDEYKIVNGTFVSQKTPSAVKRWNTPVRLSLTFGNSVSEAQRATDRKTVRSLTSRLAQATGHPISIAARANFHVFVLDEGERRAIGPTLAALIPNLDPAALDNVRNMPTSTYCTVFAVDAADNGAFTDAVAIIRSEHPPLLRKSCFHEEITQGLGLANDSPLARPSIFNDDEEFALLTHHDELLLRILYDPRLNTGMSPEVARPISAQIADELMRDNS